MLVCLCRLIVHASRPERTSGEAVYIGCGGVPCSSSSSLQQFQEQKTQQFHKKKHPRWPKNISARTAAR